MNIEDAVLALKQDLLILEKILENEVNNPKVIIETLLYSLNITDKTLDMKFSNTTIVDLTHLATIVQRKQRIEDKFASISYPGKIRITIERID